MRGMCAQSYLNIQGTSLAGGEEAEDVYKEECSQLKAAERMGQTS